MIIPIKYFLLAALAVVTTDAFRTPSPYQCPSKGLIYDTEPDSQQQQLPELINALDVKTRPVKEMETEFREPVPQPILPATISAAQEDDSKELKTAAAKEEITMVIPVADTMDSPYTNKYSRSNIYSTTTTTSTKNTKKAPLNNDELLGRKKIPSNRLVAEWDHSFDFYQKSTCPQGMNYPNEWQIHRSSRSHSYGKPNNLGMNQPNDFLQN